MELAVEMKSMELPIETMLEYVASDFDSEHISDARALILQNHRKTLLEKKDQINKTLRLLDQKLVESKG